MYALYKVDWRVFLWCIWFGVCVAFLACSVENALTMMKSTLAGVSASAALGLTVVSVFWGADEVGEVVRYSCWVLLGAERSF